MADTLCKKANICDFHHRTAKWAINQSLRRTSSGSLAMFAAIRRVSSWLNNFAAARRPCGTLGDIRTGSTKNRDIPPCIQ